MILTFVLGLMIISATVLLVARLMHQSSDSSFVLTNMLERIESDISGTHSIRNLTILEINKLKTLAACITYLRYTLMLTTLFFVIMVILLPLIPYLISILTLSVLGILF